MSLARGEVTCPEVNAWISVAGCTAPPAGRFQPGSVPAGAAEAVGSPSQGHHPLHREDGELGDRVRDREQLEAFMKAAEPVLSTLEQQGQCCRSLARGEKSRCGAQGSPATWAAGRGVGRSTSPPSGTGSTRWCHQEQERPVTVMTPPRHSGLAWVVYRASVPGARVRHWPALSISYGQRDDHRRSHGRSVVLVRGGIAGPLFFSQLTDATAGVF